MEYPAIPLFNRVLLKREEAVKKTTGGIILPDQAVNAPSIGTLLLAGDSCDESIKKLIGKRVLFTRYGGMYLDLPNVEETNYFMCDDQDILAELKV